MYTQLIEKQQKYPHLFTIEKCDKFTFSNLFTPNFHVSLSLSVCLLVCNYLMSPIVFDEKK